MKTSINATQEGSEFWREIGSGYDAVREDWNIKNSGVGPELFH